LNNEFLVVDASVALAWLVPQDESANADHLLTNAGLLCAPELILIEVAHALLKHVRRKLMSIDEARRRSDALTLLLDDIQSDAALVSPALELAQRFETSMYDGMYLALAEKLDCELVTADRRLVNATSRAARVRWIMTVGGRSDEN